MTNAEMLANARAAIAKHVAANSFVEADAYLRGWESRMHRIGMELPIAFRANYSRNVARVVKTVSAEIIAAMRAHFNVSQID